MEHTRINDIAAGQLVGIMLKLRRIAVHIKNAHLVFLRCDPVRRQSVSIAPPLLVWYMP